MIYNYTPHTVTVLNNDFEVLKEYLSNGVARVLMSDSYYTDPLIDEDGTQIPVEVKGEVSGITGLPSALYSEDNAFIVSRVVRDAALEIGHPFRDRLFVPNGLVRDTNGTVIGCQSFGI